jgi:type II secretory pathway pseudopilin PulG
MVELMVVIAIGVLMITAATLTLRNLFRSDLRSAARRTAAAMRFAADRATLTGTTVRLVFDLDKGEIWAEATEDRVSLAGKESAAESSEQKKRDGEQGAAGKDRAEARARRAAALPLFGMGMGKGSGTGAGEEGGMLGGLDARALTEDWEKDLEPPEKPAPSFQKLKGPGSRRIQLASGIKIAAVVTPRFTDPVEKGTAQVYFFPQGRSEPAIVHFTYKEEDYYSVVMRPLSGVARVYPCYYQIPSDFGVSDDKRKRSYGRDPCAAQGPL